MNPILSLASRFARPRRPAASRGLPRHSHAPEWIAALYIALVLASPWVVLAGPRVIPSLTLVTIAQAGAMHDAATAR